MNKIIFFFDTVHEMYERSAGLKAFMSLNIRILTILGFAFSGFLLLQGFNIVNYLREDIKREKSEIKVWQMVVEDRKQSQKKDSVIFVLTKIINDCEKNRVQNLH